MKRLCFLTTKKEAIINASLALGSLVLLIIGLFNVVSKIGYAACIPIVCAFVLTNTYYIEENEEEEL